MTISQADSEKMRRLAQEGMQISKIASDYYPDLDYSDVYLEIYSFGEKSSLGIKRMITNRLNAMVDNGNKKKLDCNERYYVPSEITWLLKSLGFKKIDIYGAKLGAYSRTDKLTTKDFEMLVIAKK